MIVETKADIVVGLVSARPILSRVQEEIGAGLGQYFPQCSWKLVHAMTAPGGSAAHGYAVERFGVHRVTYPWHGVPAKTNGYRVIMAAAQQAGASVCLIVDATHDGFRHSWVDALVRPGIHSRYDLVTPRYRGSARASLLSANLLSPMLLTLFGRSTAQPMSGDLLLSSRLFRHLLARDDWDSLPARLAPELWIHFAALATRCRVAETLVGPRGKTTTPAAPMASQTALAQVLESLFVLMDQHDAQWQLPAPAVSLDCFGAGPAAAPEDQRGPDGLDYLVSFVRGFDALEEEYRRLLDPRTFDQLAAFQSSLRAGNTSQQLPDAAWVRMVYEMAAAWKRHEFTRAHVLGLFKPLFLARAGSFLVDSQWKEETEVESQVSRLHGLFHTLQPVLRRLWTGRPKSGTARLPQHHKEAA